MILPHRVGRNVSSDASHADRAAAVPLCVRRCGQGCDGPQAGYFGAVMLARGPKQGPAGPEPAPGTAPLGAEASVSVRLFGVQLHAAEERAATV